MTENTTRIEGMPGGEVRRDGATKSILLTRKLPRNVEQRAARDYHAILNEPDMPFDSQQLVDRARGMDGLLITASDRIDADVMGRLPGTVKILASYAVGFEHIDLEAARMCGIMVTNTPDVVTRPTADLTFLLMLGVARRGYEAQRIMRAGGWARWTANWMVGHDVAGKKLGIIGMGRIGQAVARRAMGFDMEIHYHNRNRLSAAEEAGAIFHADPDDLLGRVDFLSLHFPANPDTFHWLNEPRIAKLRDGAYVINTSRGSVIDEGALVAALKSGKLAGAGLDVFDGEPQIRSDLLALENTFLLPHLGSASAEARDAMGFKCLDNLDVFFAGEIPLDRIA